jgi:protein-S-isoprenylcysteine O-methyltransferase
MEENNNERVRWYSGAAQREYEFLTSLQYIFRRSEGQSLETVVADVQRQIGIRKHILESIENVWDISVVLSYVLGLGFGLGVGFLFWSATLKSFGLWLCALSVFHFWEYLYVSLYHPNELSPHSFLLNHSREYTLMFLLALFEYWIEWFFFPQMKNITILICLGFFGIVGGQAIRILAMITAGSNFHHLIQTQKQKSHRLVTHGIYRWLRHPSYFGWFWWAISVPILLANPFSFFAYCYAAWSFFADRIPEEERHLIKFFGTEYEIYRTRVPTGIPFIK